MNRLTASILALGLAAGIGTASAQSQGYYGTSAQSQGYYGSNGYVSNGQPNADRYGQADGAYYDYARVVRVDPVYDTAYGYPASGQRCTSRQDTYADAGYNNAAHMRQDTDLDPLRGRNDFKGLLAGLEKAQKK